MASKNILGIIFANVHEQALDGLTAMRTMGSVPFCSRYRLIDFPLSSMVESGITKIGVITNANFQSLMDHVGTGKPWDLSRKNDGLFILPPFNVGSATMWGNRIDAIYGNRGFLEQSNQSYVIMSDCNNMLSLDCRKLYDQHISSGADITVVGVKAPMPDKISSILCFDEVDEDGRITAMSLDKEADGDIYHSVNIIIMKKYLLETLVTAAHSNNEISFQRNILMANVNKLKIHAYDATSTFVGSRSSVQAYYDVSMKLLDKENRNKIFDKGLPVYTKERDDMPSLYGHESKLNNSLVADGCIIDGTVQNSIIFKGVKVAKGAVIKNSILMQDTVVGENATLNCVIADKNVNIKSGVELSGAPTFPISLSKGTRI